MSWKNILRKGSDAWEMSQDWGTSTPQDHPDFFLTSEEMADKYNPGKWDEDFGDDWFVERYVVTETETIIIHDSNSEDFPIDEEPDLDWETTYFFNVEDETLDDLAKEGHKIKSAGIKIYNDRKEVVNEVDWPLEELLRIGEQKGWELEYLGK